MKPDVPTQGATSASTAPFATFAGMSALDTHRLFATAATILALGMAGCGGGRQASTTAHPAADPVTMAASDGATAVFRADVAPILCRYAQDIAKSTQQIARAAKDAGGPIDASAPQSAQAEYASALRLYAHLLGSDYTAFAKVHAPPSLTGEYRQFLESLATIHQQADQLAKYAYARNFTAIANEQALQTPTAGQQVFRDAGITSCTVPIS
jgi:hypothetical protein